MPELVIYKNFLSILRSEGAILGFIGIFTQYDNQLTYFRYYLETAEINLRLLSVSHAYSDY